MRGLVSRSIATHIVLLLMLLLLLLACRLFWPWQLGDHHPEISKKQRVVTPGYQPGPADAPNLMLLLLLLLLEVSVVYIAEAEINGGG